MESVVAAAGPRPDRLGPGFRAPGRGWHHRL